MGGVCGGVRCVNIWIVNIPIIFKKFDKGVEV